MLNSIKWVIVVAALMGLSACGTRLQKAESMSGEGDGFNVALHKYYTERSAAEFAEGDYVDSDYFADKGIAALKGNEVLPQPVGERHVPSDKVDVLTSSRERLLTALDGGGRVKAADDAARAQAMYDCWIQEQEENFQPDDIEFCRSEFFAALRLVEEAIAEPVVQAPPPPPEPEVEIVEFFIYFDFDKANIRADQEGPMQGATLAALETGNRTISLVCHTDTAGNVDYNQALSVRRCNSVTGALIDGGVDRGRIISVPVGETQPLIDTGDNVAEQGNRVVVMTIEIE